MANRAVFISHTLLLARLRGQPPQVSRGGFVGRWRGVVRWRRILAAVAVVILLAA